MANRGMTLNAAIKLTATQFNAGIRQVQRSLNSLKSTFLQVAGAIGAGLGFSTIIREIKETATQLSIAKATLENVAENGTKYGKNAGKGFKDAAISAKEYAENMEFLKRISNDYGQDLLGLIQAFAKFRSAAGYAGVSLEEIRRIYEALTKAAGAYHLTAEQTANAMLAVEQMFSKGKVTSEELRRQLGNALPGAFGLMAKAARMSTGEFEKALKAGQILAADVLPRFADELNKVTEGANFNSLQSSLNRISNVWTEFVEKTHFEDFYKGLVDGGANALKVLGDNFRQFRTILVELFAGVAGGKIFYNLQKNGKVAIQALSKEFSTLQTKNKQLEAQVNRLAIDYAKMSAAASASKNVSFEIKGLTAAEAKAAGLNQGLVNIIANNEKLGKYLPQYSLKASEALKITSYRASELNSKIASNNKELSKLDKKIKSGSTAWGRAFNGLISAAKTLGAAIKSALSAFVVGAIIAALAKLVQYLVDMWTYSNKLKKQAAEINREVMTLNSGVAEQITKMRALGSQASDLTKSDKERKGFIDKINTALGLTGTKMLTLKSTANDINTAIAGWVEKLSKSSKMNAMYNKIGELSVRNEELEDLIDYERKNNKKGWNNAYIERRVKRYRQEQAQNKRLMEKYQLAADKIAAEIGADAFDFTGGDNGGDNGGDDYGGGGISAKLQETLDKYKNSLKELHNQEKNGAITKAEYHEEVGKLTEKTWKEIAAYDELDKNLQSLGSGYVELAEQIKELGTIYAGHDERKKKMEEEANEAERLAEEYKKLQDKFNDIIDNGAPKMDKRDGFFDYKKTESDILDEEAENYEKYVDKWEDILEKLQEFKRDAGEGWNNNMQTFLDMLIKKVEELKKQASTIRESANLSRLTEDIKNMKKEISTITIDGFKNIADASNNLVESIMNVDKALREHNGTWKEYQESQTYKDYKLVMSILNEMIQIYNSVNQTIKTFNSLTEKSAALKKAEAITELVTGKEVLGIKEAQNNAISDGVKATIENSVLKNTVMAEEKAAEMAGASATVAAEGMKQVAIAETTTALGGEAVAGAASSQAAIPVVGPLLAAGAVAGIVALIAANSKKFAKGGIVGGNSYNGDKQIARVNSGEMILNRAQQANLYNMISKGSVGGNGNVQFKIRGTDLIGVINNTQSKMRG